MSLHVKDLDLAERTVTYRMYTVCYSKIRMAEASYSVRGRKQTFTRSPCSNRAPHAHWPVPRGPHSPQPFLGRPRPVIVGLCFVVQSLLFPASKLRQRRILGFLSATPLAITTTSLAGGTVNVSYSATLTATGGTGSWVCLERICRDAAGRADSRERRSSFRHAHSRREPLISPPRSRILQRLRPPPVSVLS